MKHVTRFKLFTAALVIALPTISEAGPPLICHPFQTSGAELLPWGTGPGWNTPDNGYDVQRLTADTLRLLTPDAPVLARMENLRRAVIYAARDQRVADQLLAAVAGRITDTPHPIALFDAGYLIESFKQAAHMHGRKVTTADGYAMVRKALLVGGSNAEMEFAAALMTSGATSAAHLQRARAAASAQSLLARNITNLGW
ncbi:MAG TPA: hypothetical protein VMO26_09560 [Vicinamibacterales bacterium]|nr:hypothetical protein [Vicinamibacterales bacterium]